MSPSRLSRLEAALRIVVEFNQARNRRDLAAMTSLISEDCIYEPADAAPEAPRLIGREAIVHFWQEFFLRYPQTTFKVEEIYGFGRNCVLRWVAEVEIEGQKRLLRGVDLFKVSGGQIQEHLSYRKCTVNIS